MKPTLKQLTTGLDELPYLTDRKSYWHNDDTIRLDNKERKEWARCFQKFYELSNSILKDFPTATIYVSNNCLTFEGPNGKGWVYLERFHKDVLLPIIETLCNNSGKQLTTINENHIAA